MSKTGQFAISHCSLCRQPTEGQCCCDRCHQVRIAFYRAGHPPPGRLDLYEFWLAAPGLETRYEVSTFGRVRNLSTGYILAASGRYPSVTLAGRTIRVHVLMAEVFLGPRPAGQLVLHQNGDRQDTWLGNLRYGTAGENAADTRRHGTRRRRCDHGHRLTPDNTLVRADGVRLCRQCLADRERRDPRSWRAWATGAVEPPD